MSREISHGSAPQVHSHKGPQPSTTPYDNLYDVKRNSIFLYASRIGPRIYLLFSRSFSFLQIFSLRLSGRPKESGTQLQHQHHGILRLNLHKLSSRLRLRLIYSRSLQGHITLIYPISVVFHLFECDMLSAGCHSLYLLGSKTVSKMAALAHSE